MPSNDCSALAADPDFHPTVAEKLRGGEVEPQGLTGCIAFRDDHRAPRYKRVLIIDAAAATDGTDAVVMECGRISKTESKTTWGERDYPCSDVAY